MSLRQAGSAELVGKIRRAKRRMRPVRVMERSVGDLSILTIQDPADVQGEMVYDCRPPLLPVSLEMSDVGPLSVRTTIVAATVDVHSWEQGSQIGGVGSDVVAFPGLGVAPLVDSGADLERTMAAALQLQHGVGLMLSNLQVLGQFVTSLNRMSWEVMRVAFDWEPFPTEAVQFVAPCSTGGALHGSHGVFICIFCHPTRFVLVGRLM